MVDDVAVVVLLLKPLPRAAVHVSTPPAGAARASACNAAANSAEAKAARDVLASLPYQNLFRHLQLVRACPIFVLPLYKPDALLLLTHPGRLCMEQPQVP
jgi:hypothetical protein